MTSFFKKTWVILASAIFLTALGVYVWPSKVSETFLYIIYDDSRAGERNQVLGVASSLKETLPENLKQVEFALKNRDDFLADVRLNLKPESKNRGIIVAAEVGSIDVLSELPNQNNLVIAHSSHQWTKDHERLKDVVDVVALPRYVITPDIQQALESSHTHLVQTPGVPHNVSSKVITKAYQDNKDQLPVAERYIGVILGGDAETPDNKLLLYTVSEAIQLADYMAPIVREKNAHLLILNGPRTGKHDPSTGKLIETSHRDGDVDAVTASFIERLKEHGLIESQSFTLLDFQFGKPSAYPSVLGALSATKSPIYVAGESTSMVSESADCLPGRVIAYTNGAMNENHRKHCMSEKEIGRISILENDHGKWQLHEAGKMVDSTGARSASDMVAEAIKNRLAEK